MTAASRTEQRKPNAKPAIVLVHGTFADASGWDPVRALLQAEGYDVIAVENPLMSFAEDVAITKRAIDGRRGDVVAVGHSYGGAVISAAATDNPRVKALVYIAGIAPEAGETFGELLDRFGPSRLGPALRPDSAGLLSIDRAQFREVFAGDVPMDEARAMAATQRPANGAIFGASLETPAWKTIPTWYVVAADDRTITPEVERFMAKRMGAQTTELASSHVPFVSRPREIAEVIVTAANATAH